MVYNIKDGIGFRWDDEFSKKDCPVHYPHTHEYSELYFHIRGKCSYMVENGIYNICCGTVVITRPNELHCVHIDEDTQYERIYFRIEENALDFLGTDGIWRCFRDRPLGQNSVLRLPKEQMDAFVARMKYVDMLYRDHSPDSSAVALAELLGIIHEVNKIYKKPSIIEEALYSTLVNSALRCINRDLKHLGSVDELADALYVSREYLSRCFSAQVGMPLSKYITRKRVEYAKTLLRRGMKLDEVCSECGWNDYSYFIYVFRRETGMTPLRYRAIHTADT